MKHRNTIAAIATAAALAGTCAVVVPAASASTSAPKTHTLTFISVQEAVHNYSETISSQQDRDVNKAGKVVGYDLLYLVFNPKTETAKLNFTAVTSGGFVYGEIADPCIPAAPGGEGGDGEGKICRDLATQIDEQITIEQSLRAGGIEIDLQGGDAGLPRRDKDRLDGIVAVFVIEDCR